MAAINLIYTGVLPDATTLRAFFRERLLDTPDASLVHAYILKYPSRRHRIRQLE